MKMTLVLLLVIPVLGCSQAAYTSSPTAPTVQSPSSGSWAVTEVITGISTSSRCEAPSTVVGKSFSQEMVVDRSVTHLTLYVGATTTDFRNAETYDGTMSGDAFTITVPFGLATGVCPGSSGTGTDKMSGSFSTDGRHLTAHEVVTDHWPDGDVVTELDWAADHK
jgi:hypothetical protein